MPPDPILALLSLVGLFLYGLVGALVGVTWVKIACEGKDLREIAFWRESSERENFVWSAVFWPVLAVPLAFIGVCFGPSRLAKRIGRYVAGALDKSPDPS